MVNQPGQLESDGPVDTSLCSSNVFPCELFCVQITVQQQECFPTVIFNTQLKGKNRVKIRISILNDSSQ